MQTLSMILEDAGFKKHIDFESIASLQVPRPHQLEGLKDILKNPRWGLWDDPGTGKSLISYLYIAALNAKNKKVIAIMPAPLVEQYANNFKDVIHGLPVSCEVMNETPVKRKEKYKQFEDREGWPNLIIYSYQMFLRDYEAIPFKRYLALVADEAHALKNPSSKIYKTVKDVLLLNQKMRFVPMTGSPAPTVPTDTYGLISLIRSDLYRSKKAFERKHCKKMLIDGFWQIVGYKNLESLSDNLYLCGRRVVKESVLDLSVPNVIPVTLGLERRHKLLYKKLLEERVLEIPLRHRVEGDEGVIDAIQAAALRRHAFTLCSFPEQYTDKKFKNAVLERLDATLDTINLQNNKVLIFANYVSTVEGLAEYLKDYNPAVVYGGSNTEENKNKFINDDTCRVCVLNPVAGGVGLDGLQNVSHDIIFLEPPTSPGLFDQSASRLVRSGQEKVVNVYVFKVTGTVFTRAVSSLLERTEDVKKTVLTPGLILNELLGGN